MYKASAEKIELKFKRPAGTSRGVLKTKNSWLIRLWRIENPDKIGVGEASIIENLSPDWNQNYPNHLKEVINNVNSHVENRFSELKSYPSIRFGLEAALINLEQKTERIYFPSEFTNHAKGIKINGLIWMGNKDFMFDQIKAKLEDGYGCLKLKIGAIDFDSELELLRFIRSKFGKDSVELRVDANGAFRYSDALQKLDALAKFDLHSIEQPIHQGQWEKMADLCQNTPLPIALDEELTGVTDSNQQSLLMSTIRPQYIILKPSLLGGFESCNGWIQLAQKFETPWWITSALESNIGLNAIAQYTFTKGNKMPQGLGTGQLFENNIESNLKIIKDELYLM